MPILMPTRRGPFRSAWEPDSRRDCMESVTAVRCALIALLAMVSTGCVAPEKVAPATDECHPTVAHMTPPSEPLEFMIGGSSSPTARSVIPTLNWYGNDAMWVLLPPNGEIVGRLGDKIPPHRMKPGYVTWSARQLDGKSSVPWQPIGPSGYGEEGFQAGGPGFPTTGCWEVTYLLAGRDELRFVLRVR